MATGVGECADRVAQSVVAGPAEPRAFGLARFDGDGRLAAVAGERGLGGLAVAAVADFGDQAGGADRGLGVAEQRAEDRAVGVVVQAGAEFAGQLGDLGDDRLQRGDEREDDLAARFGLQGVGAAAGGAAQPAEQLVCGTSPQ